MFDYRLFEKSPNSFQIHIIEINYTKFYDFFLFAMNKLFGEAAAFLNSLFIIIYSFNSLLFFARQGAWGAFFGDELEFSMSMKSIRRIVFYSISFGCHENTEVIKKYM